MVPVIQSEEMMSAITVAAVGGGNLKQEDSRRIMRELKRQADYKDEGREKKDEGRGTDDRIARRAALAAMGIGIINTRINTKENTDG